MPAISDAAGLTIDGPGAADLIISGNNAVRVLAVNSGATLILQDVTIANGLAADSRGGIFNSGGGIASTGPLAVTNSTFSSNRAADHGGVRWQQGSG